VAGPDAAVRETDTRAAIIDAARRRFRRDGVGRTKIADVAHEAGMVRQTVYDFVASRRQLLGLALASRMMEFAAPVKERFLAGDDVADDLVELLAVMTEVMSSDPECTALLEAMTPRTALQFMSAPDSDVHPVVMEVLAPVHTRAEQAGLLRSGVSLHDMAMWSRVALAPLAQREHLPPDELRTIVRRFVLPAFLHTDD
jgi:TetR/AcrR family transcriptional regulator